MTVPRLEVMEQPARILIVDDERQNRELLEVMLSAEGFVLQCASSGTEALALVAQNAPDLVLLDIMMPNMDGYEVVARIKENPATKNIPVIRVSALGDREAKMRGLTSGAEEFLTTPEQRDELCVRVNNLLRLIAYGDYHDIYFQMLDSEVVLRTADLIASEKRYRQIVESTSDGILNVDVAAKIVFANRRFGEMIGYEVPELIGKSVYAFMDETDSDVASASLTRRSHGTREIVELSFRHKNGGEVAISSASTPLFDSDGEYVGSLASLRDVTEQKKLMAQLMISDRMASVGTLAAGVAHEINNPLAVVISNLDYVNLKLEEMSVVDDVREALGDSRTAADRVRLIVRDLRIFSRTEEDKVTSVDVRLVLESTLRMAWNEVRHRARLVKDYGKTPMVRANESRLGQVFLNLIVNAAQAIPEGRHEANEIRITTRHSPVGQVIIEVSDTGPGIPPEVLKRLFTPFFTTKAVGVGTGLGLSICQRLVHSAGGEIFVESVVGKGTTFRVVLPQAPAASTVSDATVEKIAVAARRGRLLIVDDERAIGASLHRALSPDHDVVTVTRAAAALEKITAGERFDIIFCDLMMPEMTGMDLHGELFVSLPEQAQRMVFFTGGAFTPRARDFLDVVPNARIEKPFDIKNLQALIADRLR